MFSTTVLINTHTQTFVEPVPGQQVSIKLFL